MTAIHTVTVEEDSAGDLYAARASCSGTAADECHQWCADGCEEQCTGETIRLTVPGDPDEEPVAQAPLAGHRWAPMEPDRCRTVEWLEACGLDDSHGEDEPLRPGTHPITEQWDDEYLWVYAEPDPEPEYPGHP